VDRRKAKASMSQAQTKQQMCVYTNMFWAYWQAELCWWDGRSRQRDS